MLRALLPLFGMAWIGTTTLLVGMMIHRAIAGFREDDQLFLAAGEAPLAAEQARVSARMFQLTRYVHGLAWLSGGLLFTMFVIAAWVVISEIGW